MFEITKAEVIGLQSLPIADSVVADELAGLRRRTRRGGGNGDGAGSGQGAGGTGGSCLITLSNVLGGADLDVLNVLSGALGL